MPRINFEISSSLKREFDRVPWGLRAKALRVLTRHIIKAYDRGDLFAIIEDRVQILDANYVENALEQARGVEENLLDMSDEELRAKIRFIREDRRLSKVADKAPKAKRIAGAKKTELLLNSLTAEQKKALLAAFATGGKK